ncbi:unnamed protein product [Aphanomyces euteiches]|uniref:Beta-lactamase-related domain-containing protein n=1 Tax=Aphanomyces euteiches TaxID=100861 RepID=A0A6G0XBF4_9STRA|nr:hypothetical protein Ae201684_006584 [Aphanomyces euteiches]KAH9090819.1 hypothetical protein Ae201684P_006223 [Aphanomyces euteiches]KAH9155617.1 hypothetical protein AeRB84_002424 [Aphanomyces euteiches]
MVKAASVAGLLAVACILDDAAGRLVLPMNKVLNAYSYVSSAVQSDWNTKKQKVLDFVAAQHAISQSPGWALAVVHHNETLIAQGFGLNEVGNPANPVTQDSMFEIGSVTKTMIAVGIAKLVDEGRVAWKDPVKKHLPWFQLKDKYAEAYTTLHDLLVMNSVFAEGDSELPTIFGVERSEREWVEKLQYFETSRSLRQGYKYANVNFVILGQVLQEITNKTWGNYLTETIWHPLGMKHTFHNPSDTPLHTRSFGHYVCGGKIAGPFDIADTKYSVLEAFGNAAGSAVSSIHDMAIFAKFLLSKGQPLFKSSQPISDMITGHEVQLMFAGDMATTWGYHIQPSGNTIGAGYGLDVVGNAMYNGVDYFDKNGDTMVHQTRTGFVPSQGLGIVLVNNGRQVDQNSHIQRLSHVRTYILGLLLDIPEAELKAVFDESVRVADKTPIAPCDPYTFDHKKLEVSYVPSQTEKDWLSGEYATANSPEFYGRVAVYQKSGGLFLKYGDFEGQLVGQTNSTYSWDIGFTGTHVDIQVQKSETGRLVLPLGGDFVFHKVVG